MLRDMHTHTQTVFLYPPNGEEEPAGCKVKYKLNHESSKLIKTKINLSYNHFLELIFILKIGSE